MNTFTPTGMDEPETAPDHAIAVLQQRFNVYYGNSFNNHADPRHDLAVVAVDLGRRQLDLAVRMAHAAETEVVALKRLAESRIEDLAADEGTVLAPLSQVLRARVAELERTLKLVNAAYKQAWFMELPPQPGPTPSSDIGNGVQARLG